ncbi:Nephrin-like protein, partial [Leptotrombidium deliense]
TVLYEKIASERDECVRFWGERKADWLHCEIRKPQPSITWWTSDDLLLDESFFLAANGYSRNELHLNNLNRSSLMLELICRASNTNITVPLEATIFIDLNCKNLESFRSDTYIYKNTFFSMHFNRNAFSFLFTFYAISLKYNHYFCELPHSVKPLDVKIVAPQKKVSSGVRANFECRSSGSRPRPLVNWWIGSIKMTDVHESISKDGNITSSVLSFVPSVEDNGKHISCRIENPAIDASAIEDNVPQLNLALGPNINGDFVREGSDVYLECHIQANPWVYEVSWLFEGIQLTNDVTKGIIIANQSLVLQKVRRHLRGTYECYAINEEGRGASNTLFLRVQCKY